MTAFSVSRAASWWRAMQPEDAAGTPRAGDRGGLARLRRCATVMEAATEPATLALCRRLEAGEAGLERAALLAAVLAHVRQDAPGTVVARQLGTQRDRPATLSALRFSRLLQAGTLDETLTGFRRLVALAGRTLNVADLADGLWHWGEERTRLRWIYAYHDAPHLTATAEIQTQAPEDASA